MHGTGATLVQKVTNIFEYSNIFDPNIYSDIRLYQIFDMNIFEYSLVSKNFIQIYSDIRSCQNPYECYTLLGTAEDALK